MLAKVLSTTVGQTAGLGSSVPTLSKSALRPPSTPSAANPSGEQSIGRALSRRHPRFPNARSSVPEPHGNCWNNPLRPRGRERDCPSSPELFSSTVSSHRREFAHPDRLALLPRPWPGGQMPRWNIRCAPSTEPSPEKRRYERCCDGWRARARATPKWRYRQCFWRRAPLRNPPRPDRLAGCQKPTRKSKRSKASSCM